LTPDPHVAEIGEIRVVEITVEHLRDFMGTHATQIKLHRYITRRRWRWNRPRWERNRATFWTA